MNSLRGRASSFARGIANRLDRQASDRVDVPEGSEILNHESAHGSSVEPTATAEVLSIGRDAYPRADDIFHRLHLHSHVPEPESRLLELIDYFGWEKGHKAPACKRWFFRDDPNYWALLDDLGINEAEFAIMHTYGLVNRLDPGRPDMYWLYDEILERLEALGGNEKLSVLDFGCGPGQIGLSFALAGYRVVLNDKQNEYLDFARFLFEARGCEPVIAQSESRNDYYDTTADGHSFGLVVEWSVFEHVPESIRALDKISSGLVPGGMLVSTTLGKDWTPELRAHYARDSEDERIAEQIFGQELEDYVGDTFEILHQPGSLGKLLIKRS